MKTGGALGNAWRFCLAAVFASVALLTLSAVPTTESGLIRLYFLQNPVGSERYNLRADGDRQTLEANFEFTDRGGFLPVKSTLVMRGDSTPESFTAKGMTYRYVHVDTAVKVEGHEAAIRVNDQPRPTAPVPPKFFTLQGFAPLSVQMMLIRYWNTHGQPRALKLLPDGEARIEHRGRDTIEIAGRRYTLERYSVDGATWGGESIWLDANGAFAAGTTYTGGLPFEAVREEYAPALATFVKRGVEDRMVDLERISKAVSKPVVSGPLAVVGARLIDGNGGAPIEDSVIVIDNGRIVAAGARAKVTVPKGATTIDARGKTVIPGLWDMHAHYANIDWSPVYLAAGVTTARDMGGEDESLLAIREGVASGRTIGPRLLVAGWVDGGDPEGLGSVRVDTAEQARAAVKRYHDAGFEQMKLLNVLKMPAVRALTAEAHRLGMTVTGHSPNGVTAREAIDGGYDQFAHTPRLGDPTSADAREQIAYFKQHGTTVNTTESWTELQARPITTPMRTFQPGADKTPAAQRFLFSTMGATNLDQKTWEARQARTLAGIRAMHDAGVPIVAGSDKGVPGHSLLREIELYVKAGISPMEAIRAATIVPARLMKLDRESGTIEAGKVADLVLLDGNPLERIANIRTARIVISRGRVMDTATLWRAAGFQP